MNTSNYAVDVVKQPHYHSPVGFYMEIGGSIDSPSVTVGHVINFSKLLEKYFSQEYARFQAFLVYLRSRNDYGCRMRFLYFTGDFLNDLPKYQASQGLGERGF